MLKREREKKMYQDKRRKKKKMYQDRERLVDVSFKNFIQLKGGKKKCTKIKKDWLKSCSRILFSWA